MTRVDFYVLGRASQDQQFRFASRLADKAYRLGHRIFVNTNSRTEAQKLDELMWTFRDRSFVPHALVDTPLAARAAHPVLLAFGQEPGADCDLLINLALEVPEYFSRFERVAEIVDADRERRRAGREKFKFYRDRGYDMSTHKLDNAVADNKASAGGPA